MWQYNSRCAAWAAADVELCGNGVLHAFDVSDHANLASLALQMIQCIHSHLERVLIQTPEAFINKQ